MLIYYTTFRNPWSLRKNPWPLRKPDRRQFYQKSLTALRQLGRRLVYYLKTWPLRKPLTFERTRPPIILPENSDRRPENQDADQFPWNPWPSREPGRRPVYLESLTVEGPGRRRQFYLKTLTIFETTRTSTSLPGILVRRKNQDDDLCTLNPWQSRGPGRRPVYLEPLTIERTRTPTNLHWILDRRENQDADQFTLNPWPSRNRDVDQFTFNPWL